MKPCGGWRRLLLCFPLLFIVPRLLSVMELHRESKMDELLKKARNKFDHLVIGPAAGQGFSSRLQCQGTKALNKTHFSLPSSRSNVGKSIAFVTVFTVYNSSLGASKDGRPSDVIIVGNSSYNKVERSMAILNIFINFIQVAMPQSGVIILTDPASDLSVNRNGVSIYPIQGEYSRDKLMLQRIRSYIVFLERKLEEYSEDHMLHYIFTDSDIAVVGDLGQIFNDFPDFDLALTFRNNKQQPLNSGFIAVRGTREGISS